MKCKVNKMIMFLEKIISIKSEEIASEIRQTSLFIGLNYSKILHDIDV